ncbi:GatB/YqeY domain-containing protein [Geobacter sp. SVR]|uniref:GatB/YqeY domain-containing protein n=1 Tax=Geobacter sp. SVR TaxID=2495594 RepID=UPI00143F00BF|nr:GatB/YqeY domain-containing protein [Geobacter sp. SVR]BCS52594.1 aspartyl-tRNA amidotransferase subunit B [Geobacter sp. SVR]GCF83968.1 aspartyl-tRNA amidotransferase subunit B [Geobacter sp. SVR]
MALKEELTEAMKQAMKARDDLRLSAVRMIRSAVKNREIDQMRELDDQGIIEVISSLAKQRRESIRLYREGNREDLAAKEQAELDVLLGFLPRQMETAELEQLVERIISETGAAGPKDMGIVMKAVTPLTAGKADGKVVSDIVRRRLS